MYTVNGYEVRLCNKICICKGLVAYYSSIIHCLKTLFHLTILLLYGKIQLVMKLTRCQKKSNVKCSMHTFASSAMNLFFKTHNESLKDQYEKLISTLVQSNL